MLPRIIADDNIPFLKGVLEPFATVRYLSGQIIDRSNLIGADALIVRTRTACSADLLKGTAIKIIASATIGFDHIDTRYCDSHNIQWVTAPGCNANSVCQYLASALFILAKKGGFCLADKTLGIIGAGHVGSKVEQLARLLGMKVLLNDPPRQRKEDSNQFVSLERILKDSDLITFHVPLNRDGKDPTFHLMNETNLRKIKPGVFLINTSRGEVVHTAALKQLIREGLVAGTVLDVWENEPIPDSDLLNLSIIGTPHIAGYSVDGKANGTAAVVRAVAAYFNFPLQSWFPPHLPFPEKPIIQIEGRGKSSEEIIGETILKSYNILNDADALKENPLQFEQLRNQYPPRREYPAFIVTVREGTDEIQNALNGLGFICEKYGDGQPLK
ncbi:MAG: 4-phosphoerythronate dehydrogenase [Bacteroidales bacterium]|nr:4-phosphoerythronate dehydrogenase [Bacteroidales bacterium]